MGREIRRLPPNWEHPKRSDGSYQPMYDSNYIEECEEWLKGLYEFEEKKKLGALDAKCQYYWEYWGGFPDEEYYHSYKAEDATWFQLYETVSEGTPLTPPFATEDELIDYLVEHGDFWYKKPFEREVAEKFVKRDQWAPSMIFDKSTGTMYSGIECSKLTK